MSEDDHKVCKAADNKYQAAAHRSVYYLVNNLYIIYIIYMPYEEEQDMSSRVSFSTNIFFPMIIIIMIMYSDGTWYQSIQDPIVIFHRTRYQPSLLIPNLKRIFDENHISYMTSLSVTND